MDRDCKYGGVMLSCFRRRRLLVGFAPQIFILKISHLPFCHRKIQKKLPLCHWRYKRTCNFAWGYKTIAILPLKDTKKNCHFSWESRVLSLWIGGCIGNPIQYYISIWGAQSFALDFVPFKNSYSVHFLWLGEILNVECISQTNLNSEDLKIWRPQLQSFALWPLSTIWLGRVVDTNTTKRWDPQYNVALLLLALL